MTTSTLGQLWKNEYFQTVIMILLVPMVVFGFFFGLRLVLNTDYPMLAVASGSMCVVQPNLERETCDGWSHPFGRTLHTGDLIIVQGVRPEDIYAAPFNESERSGDILVFRLSPESDDLIVHRAVGVMVENGETRFVTKGDGNGGAGPGSPTPAKSVIGKVVFRIPWIGHLALLSASTRTLVLVLMIIVIVVEFVFSMSRSEETETGKDETVDKISET